MVDFRNSGSDLFHPDKQLSIAHAIGEHDDHKIVCHANGRN